MGTELYDVVAVSIATGKVEELVAQGKTFRNAEAVENMAVMRRGCDVHFFATVTAGRYQEGDRWETEGEG